jgi:protein involved in ribonucleotide reduction
MLVYFSSTSENTKRFVEKTGIESARIPIHWHPLLVDEPFLLVVPSYGAGRSTDAIPKQVIKFLNIESNRSNLVGVIGSGNRNYGHKYCLGAYKVAEKCGVDVLHTYEILGLQEDVEKVVELHESLC